MKSLRGSLYAIVSSATFGLIPLFSIPLLASGMRSAEILFYRMVFAAVIIGEVIFRRVRGNFAFTLATVAFGAIIYYLVLQVVLLPTF